MILKLGIDHLLKVYIYINDDPGLTLTCFMARSNLSNCFLCLYQGKSQVSFTGPLVCMVTTYIHV